MIQEWLGNGDLPPRGKMNSGRHMEERLAFNVRRRQLLAGFRQGCDALRKAGCSLVYLDGSFVTAKTRPGDFDACWDISNVDDEVLDPVFWDFSDKRTAQKRRLLGEFFPAQLPDGATGKTFVEFFQRNKLDAEAKGVLAIRLNEE
jgi:hypothetical protein